MSACYLPPCRVDPARLPPLLLTSEPGSFARDTLARRIPGILLQTLSLNDFPGDIRAALRELHDELTGGRIRPLHEEADDVAFWNAASAPCFGRTWLDVPWYWAETYFYRRLLEATRYFQPGPGREVDPFAAVKRQEWAPDAAPRAVGRLLATLPAEDLCSGEVAEGVFERLLHASLWGNRTDLSYMIAAHLGATAGPGHERSNLLVDDAGAVWRHLVGRAGGRVALLADNAGTELLMDAVLIDFLLCSGLAGQVHLHLKPQPFYVSDAMLADLADGLDALSAGGAAARHLALRLTGHITSGDLVLKAHWANATCLFYCQMPDDLHDDLVGTDLVVVKGDANYRRLVGDVHWPPAASFADAVRYFPAPVVALRTFKSEVVAGLQPGEAERLSLEDPSWLVNGQRGVIQARLP